MPVTRSQGRAAQAWIIDARPGRRTPPIVHDQPPFSPTTTEGSEQPPPPPRGGEDLPCPAAERGSEAPPCPPAPQGGEDRPRPPTPRGGEERPAPSSLMQTEASSSLRPPGTSAEEYSSEGTLKACDKTYNRAVPLTTRVDARTELKAPSHRSTASNRKIRNAREDLLKIKLELAQIALQRAEEESDDDYMDDRNSNEEYIRSWLEEAPEPDPQDAAAEGGHRPPDTLDLPEPPPSAVIVNPVLRGISTAPGRDAAAEGGHRLRGTLDKPEPPPSKTIDTEALPSMKKPVEDTAGGEGLRPFITELTSAIASLAGNRSEEKPVYHNPAASKVIMTLPNFSGLHTEWLSFRAIYETTRPYFNDVENTARLRRSLRGRALDTVSSELIGNARPDDIMKELELQFGRPDSIAQAETDRLRGLPRCGEAPKDICTFASRVRSGIVTLRALKKEHYLMNAELMRILTEKLPNSLRVQWYKTYTEKYQSTPDLSLFSDFITEQARYCSAFAPPENISEATGLRRVTQRTHTTIDKKPASKCRICEMDGHRSLDCHKFVKASADKKWELAKQHNMCFRCLRHRQHGHRCQKKRCGIEGCTASHHHLLHYKKKASTTEVAQEAQEIVASSRNHTNQAFLKIVPVQLSGPAGEVRTYALLDDGSTVSLIDEELADMIGAEGPVEPMKIGAISDVTIDTPTSKRVDLTLSTCHRKKIPFRARTIPRLHLSPQSISKDDIADCKHLFDLADQLTYNAGTPKIIIGQDNWHLLLATDIRRGPQHQPIASLTPLGWVLHGARTRILGQQVHYVNQLNGAEESIDKQLREYFALESLIINPCRPASDPEKRAEDILQRSIVQLEDGRLQTALLWRSDEIQMPDSYATAMNRLVSIEKKLDKNPDLKTRYMAQMDSLIEKGYAEKAPLERTPGRTWYLPHFDVFNPMKPEKLRIVHDAAAKTRGMSLNDYLLTGPDLLQSLPGVMMRFRRHRVAVSGDITEMFMQVKVKPEDRDALRYLWRGERREGAPEEYRMTSIIFGAASSPCTAIFAKNWNAKRHANEHPEAVEAIVKNHYMDDYLDSFRSTEEATRTIKIVQEIHSKARFDLTKWVSNSEEVLRELVPGQETTQIVTLGNIENIEKVLGVIWKPHTDELSFNLKLARLPTGLLDKETPTKREALKIVMSLYDPLGLASPITIRAKQILQEAWRRGVDWDQPLDEELSSQWRAWISHLEQLKNVNIPRCYPGYSEATEIQVHVFTDASEKAYATAVYWRSTTRDNNVHVSLVMAKAKVAPLKLLSIPRLELQAAVMGTRVAAAVIYEHNVKPASVTYWSDSRTVLTWIRKGARSYKPFVAHRLAAIEENSRVEEWRWVPTKSNIADAATRDVPTHFHTDHEWYRGPKFLYDDPSTWPTESPADSQPTGEEKTVTLIQAGAANLIDVVPDPVRFSRWERLLRATARVLQFISLCRKQHTEKTFYKRTKKNKENDPDWSRAVRAPRAPAEAARAQIYTRKFIILDATYIQKAEKLLVRVVQQEAFKQEIASLESNETVASSSRLYPLRIELNDGVIVLRSRIAAVDKVAKSVKSPPVLDGDHRITQLYIDWTHRSLQHSGTELVVNEVRQHYWIVRLRPTVKQVIARCLHCRIRRARAPTPATGDHPKTRLAHHRRPFTYTGLDYFGPLSVTVGRQHHKRYVALFTCLTTRAVHLEIAHSLSADSAVLALRRFAARRGCPTEIYSDNGTNMHGADRELREAWQEEASRRGIAWRFITPSAPFMGGAWERLVRCVKTALGATLHERHPREEVLATLLCEVEYVVNSRPLTHVSVSGDDDESITPNHFLLGGSARLPSPGTFDERDIDSKKHWRRAQILADMFWRRWVREYLPELQYRREPHARGPALQLGDPVLIADGNLPRNTWPRGRVVAVYPGADGEVRTADVRTAGGILKRPTKKLVPLPK
ncbi:uncharacterized protein LOC126055473 [Helicoverpa armigera]|uniref:uncharacterized protein LOC126055473 n=1 Tax=Helicoverpa armigera TaxID=29058 RepID=UPI003082DB2C